MRTPTGTRATAEITRNSVRIQLRRTWFGAHLPAKTLDDAIRHLGWTAAPGAEVRTDGGYKALDVIKL